MRCSGCSSRIASSPALRDQRPEGGAAFRLDQRILVPRLRGIDIDLGRRDVVVAGQHHGDILLQELCGMGAQALEPVELVIEFRSRLRIAVRQIDAGDDDAVDGGFDIARLVVVGVAGQAVADQYRLGLARQNGDAVPGFLAAPHRAVASLFDRRKRKLGIGLLSIPVTRPRQALRPSAIAAGSAAAG